MSYVALADFVGDAFAELRTTLPSPQEHALAAALLVEEAGGAADPRTTATALVGILTVMERDGPLLLAIDDVQWLDRASERALAFAIRRLPPRVGLVLTRRGDGADELPLGLERALTTTRVERLTLAPLSLAGVHHLIRTSLGSSLPRPLLTRITAASGGNPFFALELARALATDPEPFLGGPLPVPARLSNAIGERVRGLSAGARDLAFVASCLPRPTAAAIAEAVEPETDMERSLAEAEAAGVLISAHGRIRFAHPLLASTIYGSVPENRRRDVHRRLAQLTVAPEERALHRARCTTVPDETIASEIEIGARAADQRGAHDEAAELFVAAQRLTPPERCDERARRLLGEALAVASLNDFAGARSRAERVIEVARASSVRAEALALLGTIAWIGGDPGTAVEYVEQALHAATNDALLASRLRVNLVRFGADANPARAVEHADAAIPLLAQQDAPALLAHVLIDRCVAGASAGLGARSDLLERGIELEAAAMQSRESGPRPFVDGPHPLPIVWFQAMDNFDAARARFAFDDEWFREHGFDVRGANRQSYLACAELRAGRWDLATQYIEECCAVLTEYEGLGVFAVAFAWQALIDAHLGRIDRARSTLEKLDRIEPRLAGGPALSVTAFVEFVTGDYRAADEALLLLRAQAERRGVKDLLLDRSEPFHVEALIALGELDRAKQVLARLEERGRTLPRPWTAVTLPRARALVLAAEGEPNAALAALDELDLAAAARLPFEFAWHLLVRGQLLRRSKQRRAAADTLAEAAAIFEWLGAPTWMEKTRAELDRLGLRQRAPDELTATELRVAELAASGLTNKEVAAAAFMSPKTVEANLARVYRKLSIRSRAELGARIAAEQRDAPVEP